jgi:hypothetical protein
MHVVTVLDKCGRRVEALIALLTSVKRVFARLLLLRLFHDNAWLLRNSDSGIQS